MLALSTNNDGQRARGGAYNKFHLQQDKLACRQLYALSDNVQLWFSRGHKGDQNEHERVELTKKCALSVNAHCPEDTCAECTEYWYCALWLGELYSLVALPNHDERSWVVTEKDHHISIFYLPIPIEMEEKRIKKMMHEVVSEWKKGRSDPLSRPDNVPPYRMAEIETTDIPGFTTNSMRISFLEVNHWLVEKEFPAEKIGFLSPHHIATEDHRTALLEHAKRSSKRCQAYKDHEKACLQSVDAPNGPIELSLDQPYFTINRQSEISTLLDYLYRTVEHCGCLWWQPKKDVGVHTDISYHVTPNINKTDGLLRIYEVSEADTYLLNILKNQHRIIQFLPERDR